MNSMINDCHNSCIFYRSTLAWSPTAVQKKMEKKRKAPPASPPHAFCATSSFFFCLAQTKTCRSRSGVTAWLKGVTRVTLSDSGTDESCAQPLLSQFQPTEDKIPWTANFLSGGPLRQWQQWGDEPPTVTGRSSPPPRRPWFVTVSSEAHSVFRKPDEPHRTGRGADRKTAVSVSSRERCWTVKRGTDWRSGFWDIRSVNKSMTFERTPRAHGNPLVHSLQELQVSHFRCPHKKVPLQAMLVSKCSSFKNKNNKQTTTRVVVSQLPHSTVSLCDFFFLCGGLWEQHSQRSRLGVPPHTCCRRPRQRPCLLGEESSCVWAELQSVSPWFRVLKCNFHFPTESAAIVTFKRSPLRFHPGLRHTRCFCYFHFVSPTHHAQLDLVRGRLCALPMWLRIYLHAFRKWADVPRKRANANAKKAFLLYKKQMDGGGKKGGGGAVVPSELAVLPCSVMKRQNVLSLPSHIFFFCCHVYIQRTPLYTHTHYFASTTCLSPQTSPHWPFTEPHRWHKFSSKILISLCFFNVCSKMLCILFSPTSRAELPVKVSLRFETISPEKLI